LADGSLEASGGFIKGFLLIAQHTEMKMGFREVGVEANGFRKLRRSIVGARLANKLRAQVIVQIGTVGLKLDGTLHFGNSGIEIA